MLYIVATPLGNLEDISTRALNALQRVDFILAEDTRRTRQLLESFGIKKEKGELHSFNEFASEAQVEKIIDLLGQDSTFALVTDAGTPGISDPGPRLISTIRQNNLDIKIVPIPGPSAVTTALSVSGFPANTFVFWGYTPKKAKKRKELFNSIIEWNNTQVFFSTPPRIVKDLEDLQEAGFAGNRQIFVAREMTKQFESYHCGTLPEVISQIKNSPQKGEFSVVIGSGK